MKDRDIREKNCTRQDDERWDGGIEIYEFVVGEHV